MKISDIELIPAAKYLFVKVHTDSGVYGIGEVGVWGYLDAAAATINKMKTYFIGQDPMKIEHHWNFVYRSMYFRGSVVMSAISAIDIALWDIKGKTLGVPVYELIGGKCRDMVRTYAPVFQYVADDMAAGCVEIKKRGFSAARIIIPDVAGPAYQQTVQTYSAKVKGDIEKIKACREAVGHNFDLCVEVHRSMTPAEAIAFAKGIEEYHPLFIEDPIAPDNPAVMAEIAAATSIPIATGERAISIQEIQILLSYKAARYIRPDVCTVGGLTAAKKIASIAESHYCGIIPHNPLGPVSTAACLQLDACVPNFTIQEFPSFNFDGGEDSMVKNPLQIQNGHIVIPDVPGIGIELIDNITEKFPPRQRDITAGIGFDGSVVDR